MQACPRGGNTCEGRLWRPGRERGGATFFFFVYSVVLMALCVSTGHMFQPVPCVQCGWYSQSSFWHPLRPNSRKWLWVDRICNVVCVDSGCGVHVTAGREPACPWAGDTHVHKSLTFTDKHTGSSSGTCYNCVWSHSWRECVTHRQHSHKQAMRPLEYLAFSVDTCEQRN